MRQSRLRLDRGGSSWSLLQTEVLRNHKREFWKNCNENYSFNDIKKFSLRISQNSTRFYLCWFVLGLNSAIAVSVNGAKKIFPPYGLAPMPIPCDDFFPTNFTGNSFPTGKGPARSAAAGTEKSLRKKFSHFIRNTNRVWIISRKLISPVSSQWLEINCSRFYIKSHANDTVRKVKAIISENIQWSG